MGAGIQGGREQGYRELGSSRYVQGGREQGGREQWRKRVVIMGELIQME